jgi:hypothetical protein
VENALFIILLDESITQQVKNKTIDQSFSEYIVFCP